MTRTDNLLLITRRLVIMTAIVLACVALIFGVTLVLGTRFMVSWACFGCGILGGFISIQQRLKTIGDHELDLLAKSWFEIALVPIYGGLFALILYIGLLGQIITGAIFPKFVIAPFGAQPTTDDLMKFFINTYPASGEDLAKLLFWCLIAGFSERLVPQIMGKTASQEAAGKGE